MSDLFEVDGVSLRSAAYNIMSKSGRYSMPGIRGEDLVLAGRSGYQFVADKPYDAGIGALAVWVTGADPVTGLAPATHLLRQAQFNTNMAVLQRLFTRRHRLSTVRAGQPDASIRTAQVQWVEWSEPEVVAGGTRAVWSIGYSIPAVFWEDESLTTQATTAGSSLPKTLDLTSFAGMTGVIEDGLLEVPGPITNPRVTVSETGHYVEYIGTVPSGQTWSLDAKLATSIVNSVSVMADTRHAGGYGLFSVPNVFVASTTPRIVLSGTSGGGTTLLRFIARRKWVSA